MVKLRVGSHQCSSRSEWKSLFRLPAYLRNVSSIVLSLSEDYPKERKSEPDSHRWHPVIRRQRLENCTFEATWATQQEPVCNRHRKGGRRCGVVGKRARGNERGKVSYKLLATSDLPTAP